MRTDAPLARLKEAVRARGLFSPRRSEDDAIHPERLAVLAEIEGDQIVEIGCGPRKTRNDFVAVDLTPGGQRGSVGNAAGRASQADIAASGDALPFPTARFDTLVARHNLEHYIDTVATLREWYRVVRVGGRLVAVVPDEDGFDGRTVLLDPTHMHSFNERSLANLLPLVGWEVEKIAVCVPNWSLLVAARRR